MNYDFNDWVEDQYEEDEDFPFDDEYEDFEDSGGSLVRNPHPPDRPSFGTEVEVEREVVLV